MGFKQYFDIYKKAKEKNINVNVNKLNHAICKYNYDWIMNNLEKLV